MLILHHLSLSPRWHPFTENPQAFYHHFPFASTAFSPHHASQKFILRVPDFFSISLKTSSFASNLLFLSEKIVQYIGEYKCRGSSTPFFYLCIGCLIIQLCCALSLVHLYQRMCDIFIRLNEIDNVYFICVCLLVFNSIFYTFFSGISTEFLDALLNVLQVTQTSDTDEFSLSIFFQ